MTALEAYIESTRCKQDNWSKISETIREAIINAIEIGNYCIFITAISAKDKRLLTTLKYNVHFNDGGYWVISWRFKTI